MTYALIENGTVTNIISANNRGADSLIATGLNLVGTEKLITIGDTYDGTTFYRDGVEVLSEKEQRQAEISTYKAALQTLGVDTEEQEVEPNAG